MDTCWKVRFLVHRWEFLSAKEKELVFRRLESPEDWQKVSRADLETWLGRPVRARWDAAESLRRLRQDLRFLEDAGTFVWCVTEPGFPPALAEIADPPWLVWGRGKVPDLEKCWMAVVGTRFPSERAKTAAWEFSRGLARAGVVVVSGLARGIDAQAHWGCIGVGPSVGVLGNGIDTVSPAGNQRLAARMLGEGGCLLSEYGPGEPAFPYRFVARNRLISGLCRSVMVVQAPERSGALITADFALDQGRDVVVHRDGLDGERGAGTLALARQGAPVLSGAMELDALWTGEPVVMAGRQLGFEGFDG